MAGLKGCGLHRAPHQRGTPECGRASRVVETERSAAQALFQHQRHALPGAGAQGQARHHERGRAACTPRKRRDAGQAPAAGERQGRDPGLSGKGLGSGHLIQEAAEAKTYRFGTMFQRVRRDVTCADQDPFLSCSRKETVLGLQRKSTRGRILWTPLSIGGV